MAAPDPKRQYQQQQQQVPPEYKPFEEAGEKRNPINETNAQAIKDWLNNLKPKFIEYLAKKTAVNQQRLVQSGENMAQAYRAFMAQEQAAAESAYGFSQHLWNYLTLYRGEIVGHYLDEAAWEVIFSAMGPVGNMMRMAYQKNITWKMAWMKNILNPNAIYYYVNALPAQAAFDVLKYPGRAVFAILEAGGAPLLSKVHVPEWHYDKLQGRWTQEVKQKVVFAPLFRAIQTSHALADHLDKTNGLSYDKKRFNSWLEETNNTFTEAYFNHDKNKLKQLLKKYDGNIFRHALANTASRLRSTERDPLSYLVALIGGLIWDFSLGLILNTLRLGITRAIGVIPGINALRGQLIKFFTSNSWLQTASMGRVTGSTFLKGTFSTTTASSTYGGAWLGTQIAKILGIPALPAQIIGGGLGAIAGSIYTTSLKLANIPAAINWTQTYQDLRMAANSQTLARAYAQELLDQGYIRGGRGLLTKGYGLEPLSFRPGPMMNLASWLNRNWLVRLPINGFVLKDILLRVLPPEFLGVKILGIPLGGIVNWLPAIDYLWQIKGGLLRTLTQPSFKLFGKTFVTPYYRFLSLQNPSSFLSKVAQSLRFQWLKIGYGEPAGFLYQERPWLKGINQFLNNISRVFKAAQPYAQNFFNPGFFFGFGLVPILTPSMGFWAYVAGPTLGSAGWLASTRIAAAILPKGLMSPATFMAKFNALGWSGYFIGQVTGWIFFGWNVPLWYTAAWTFGVPMFGLGLNLSFSMIANALGMTVSSLVQGLLGPAYGAFAGAMAIGSTIAAVLSIASLTIFTGFVIYAGFWVPMIEESKAGQQSSNFYISNNCTQTGTNQYNCCSNFNLTENVLNSRNFLDHNTDFAKTDLTVDLNDPEATTDAFRGIALIYTTFVPQWVNGTNYSLVIPPGNIVGGAQPYPHDLYAFLPTPTDQAQTLKELMQQNQSVVYSMKPFFDILTALAKEHQPCLPNPKVPCSQDSQLIAEYKAQLALMKKQKELVDDLIPPIEDGKLDKALSVAMGYDPCPDPNQPCPEEKQGLKTTVNRYVSAIKLYLSQTDPDLTSFLAQLEQELKGLEQQIDLLPGIINQMEEIQKDMADADAAIILDPNFSFYNFSDEVWRLLNTYFSDAFNTKNNFYFIPQGTNYQVCVDTQYTGPIPASPQTVCSTISYTPSVWGPNTAFAKACTTFTPQ